MKKHFRCQISDSKPAPEIYPPTGSNEKAMSMRPFVTTIFACLTFLASARAEIVGKLFHVNPENRTFELLKETEYDPKTAIGRSRFSATWTEKAVLRKVEEKTSFAGMKGQVWAKFQGIDAANRKAVAEGKPFVTRVATITEGITSAPEQTITDNEVTGWFTPDTGEAPRGGTISINGTSVPVTLRGKNSKVVHYSALVPAELARGFWQATLDAREENGRLVVDRIDATPLPDPRLTDDPKLPRVLVIGDSISMNYHDAAKAALAGVANYHRNEGNASSSAHGVSNTELWLGNYQEKGFHWDVIQFNHGLHDLKQTYDAKTGTWGEYNIPLADYQANLEKEIAILKKTGARLIWCTTTPVPNDIKSQYARRKGASAIFNAAALEVIKRHPDILVTDLHALVDTSPAFKEWRKGADVHFYQKEEQRLLGEAVAATIRKAIAGK
jgi:hypothetical protein